MHILVLGGTGNIGLLVIRELLSVGYTVVIYARSPQKLASDIATHPSVTVIKGELSDASALSDALTTPTRVDAVVSVLGSPTSPLSALKYPSDTPLAKGYAVLLECMRTLSVPRLIALGTASMKDPADKHDAVFQSLVLGVHVLAPKCYADVVAIGNAVRASDRRWTLARVPLLTNGETREYQCGYVGDGARTTTLTRVAFAAFVVDELQRDESEWIGKAPLITQT